MKLNTDTQEALFFIVTAQLKRLEEQNTRKACHELYCIDILYQFFLEKGKNVAWFQTKITAKHQSVYQSHTDWSLGIVCLVILSLFSFDVLGI